MSAIDTYLAKPWLAHYAPGVPKGIDSGAADVSFAATYTYDARSRLASRQRGADLCATRKRIRRSSDAVRSALRERHG